MAIHPSLAIKEVLKSLNLLKAKAPAFFMEEEMIPTFSNYVSTT